MILVNSCISEVDKKEMRVNRKLQVEKSNNQEVITVKDRKRCNTAASCETLKTIS